MKQVAIILLVCILSGCYNPQDEGEKALIRYDHEQMNCSLLLAKKRWMEKELFSDCHLDHITNTMNFMVDMMDYFKGDSLRSHCDERRTIRHKELTYEVICNLVSEKRCYVQTVRMTFFDYS